MSPNTENIEIISPIKQLQLFGYEYHFNSFIKLFQKKKLPNTVLLSGLKGSGKATFVYHFANYLLSHSESNKYLISNFTINPENRSYKLLCNNTHPNFFLLQNNKLEEKIKIESVREMLKFLNKSTFNSNIKIVLIDNAENLNINSSNALLKALEEPSSNTFFFIIHNSVDKILDTIKSRSIEFKIFFTSSAKKRILDCILKQYDFNFNMNSVYDNFYFDSHGGILKHLKFLNEGNTNSLNDKLSCITHLVDQYKQKKDPQLLSFLSFFVEIFYNELSLKNSKNLNVYFYNKSKILKQINDVKRFNLDKKNLFISLLETIKNEK